jgi:Zn ribbon nucleic-acid-binding protein
MTFVESDHPRSGGGQFTGAGHDEVAIDLAEPEQPPLADYRVIGFTRKATSPTPGVTLPGSICFHCGAGIMNCVQIRHVTTGEVVDVGMDCAERTGLDRKGLSEMMAERRQAERDEQAQLSRAARAARDAELAALHGEHGTLQRFESGCWCPECRATAPHGTMTRFEDDNCSCGPCVAVALQDPDWERQDTTVLVDITTGKVIDHAKIVPTRYGPRWVVEDPDTGDTDWYPVGPKRRSTSASKGVLEAETSYLARRTRNGWWPKVRLTEPTVDAWGEPITVA